MTGIPFWYGSIILTGLQASIGVTHSYSSLPFLCTLAWNIDAEQKWYDYCIARKFRGVKFSRKLIRRSFHDFIFTDSDPIAIINDVNIVSHVKIFAGGDKSAEIAKNVNVRNFLAIQYAPPYIFNHKWLKVVSFTSVPRVPVLWLSSVQWSSPETCSPWVF